jgi:hypothetical protein
MVRIASSVLGCRCRLFRLSVLTFTEYLYFSGKIDADTFDEDKLSSLYIPNERDFTDYLEMNNIRNGLKLNLDTEYLRGFYAEIKIANDNRAHTVSNFSISEEDVVAMGHLIAYSLSESVNYNTFVSPAGDREVNRVGRKPQLDFNLAAETELGKSVRAYRQIKDPIKRARILELLLEANLAFIEVPYESRNLKTYEQFLEDIKNVAKNEDFADIIENYNICLINPLLYARLGKDLLDTAGLDIQILYDSFVKGLLLENYIQGSYVNLTNKRYYWIYKVGGVRGAGPEIDLYDEDNGVLCEITTYNKNSKINVTKHFKNEKLIRIACVYLEAEPGSAEDGAYHRIPYLKLCIMTDAGSILKLGSS